MDVEILKVYDEKGHTVLKKKVLRHLGVGRGDLIAAYLVENRAVLLKPAAKEELLARLKKPSREDAALREKAKIHYDVS